MILKKVNTYKEACEAVRKVGILPLSELVTGYPSLESLTDQSQWHTGSERDPWLWRARFPRDGTALYGKFFKKKAMLISREMFPWVTEVLRNPETMEERYESGLVSKSVFAVYEAIRVDGEIETRALKAVTWMKAKENKTAFDNAIVELQE